MERLDMLSYETKVEMVVDVRVDRPFPIGSPLEGHKPRQLTVVLKAAGERITGRDNCILLDGAQ